MENMNREQEYLMNRQPEIPISAEKNPKKKREWLKYMLIVLGVILFILASIFFFIPGILSLATSDIDPIDSSDLTLPIVNIPDSDNIYFDMLVFNHIHMSKTGDLDSLIEINIPNRERVEGYIDGTGWSESIDDKAYFQLVSDENLAAFEVFDRMQMKSNYQSPESADPANITPNLILPTLFSYRQLAMVETIRAFHLFGEDEKAGLDETLKIIALGQKIQNSQGSLIEYLVGVAIKQIGLNSLFTLLNRTTLPFAELEPYISELEQYVGVQKGSLVWPKSDYYSASAVVDILSSGDGDEIEDYYSYDPITISRSSYYFRPNETRLLFADLARQRIADARTPCSQIERLTPEDSVSSLSYMKQYFTENIVGKIGLEISIAAHYTIHDKSCDLKLHASINQALIALKGYEEKNGELPDSLDALVPEFIASVPLDSYDGYEIRYSKDARFLYSVGVEGIDVGGSPNTVWNKAANPTFSIY